MIPAPIARASERWKKLSQIIRTSIRMVKTSFRSNIRHSMNIRQQLSQLLRYTTSFLSRPPAA